MQPYRQMVLPCGTAMTCLDPPPTRDGPCPNDARSGRMRDGRPRASRLFVGAATVLAIGLAWLPAVLTLERFSRSSGRIDIAPEALERLRAQRAGHPPTSVTITRAHLPAHTPTRPPPANAAAQQRAVMPWFDGHEHDPGHLVAGARTLQKMGVDVTLADVELPRSTIDCFDTFGYWPALAFPASSPPTALDLGDLPSDSPALAAGLRKNDLLLTIDGYRVADWGRADLEKVRGRGSIALEVDRNGRRVLLTIRWSTKWKQA